MVTFSLSQDYYKSKQMAAAGQEPLNFGLSQEVFEDMVDRLRRGDTTLLDKVFVAQFQKARQLIIKQYNASAEDAYDAVLEAVLDFQKRLVAGSVQFGALEQYFNQIAKTKYLRFLEARSNKGKEIYTDQIMDNQIEDENILTQIENMELNAEYKSKFRKAWENLCGECQKLLTLNVCEGLRLDQIAQMWNESHDAIKQRKKRTLDRFRGFFFGTIDLSQKCCNNKNKN